MVEVDSKNIATAVGACHDNGSRNPSVYEDDITGTLK
jgi:hypothetical protein